MKFRLEFSMDNAAFSDNAAPEVARILRELASRIEVRWYPPGAGCVDWPVLDINGNKVGRVEIAACS